MKWKTHSGRTRDRTSQPVRRQRIVAGALAMTFLVTALVQTGSLDVEAQGTPPEGVGSFDIVRWDRYFPVGDSTGDEKITARQLVTRDWNDQDVWYVTTNHVRHMDRVRNCCWEYPQHRGVWFNTEFGQRSSQYPNHVDFEPGNKDVGESSYSFSLNANGPGVSFGQDFSHEWGGQYRIDGQDSRESNGWSLRSHSEDFRARGTSVGGHQYGHNFDHISHGNVFKAEKPPSKGVFMRADYEHRTCWWGVCESWSWYSTGYHWISWAGIPEEGQEEGEEDEDGSGYCPQDQSWAGRPPRYNFSCGLVLPPAPPTIIPGSESGLRNHDEGPNR